MNNDNKVIL